VASSHSGDGDRDARAALDDWARHALTGKSGIERDLLIADKATALQGVLDNPLAEVLAAIERVGGNGSGRARVSLPGDTDTTLQPALTALADDSGIGNGLEVWATHAAALPPVERALARERQITELRGVVSSPARLVDAALAQVAARERGQGSLAIPEVAPAEEPVEGALLLSDLATVYTKHVALPEAGAEALALYTVATYLADAFSIFPLLALLSAVKRSGKTTALAVASALVARPLPASNISTAAVFRIVERHHPTLLIDEADAFLKDNEELRGILNAGHTKATAYVVRLVGDDHEPVVFSVWGPKIIAGIGRLAGTLEDRSIIVPMRRRAPGEQVERLRLDRLDELEPLARRCRRFADDNRVAIGHADPEIPDLTSDRAADNWRPMLAIADAAGGEWPERARWAAIVLSGADESDGAGVQLLADLAELFTAEGVDRLPSDRIVRVLGQMEERPWPEWRHGQRITPRQLAALLKPFGIKPVKYRDGAETARGYLLEELRDAFTRYLSGTSGTCLQTGTSRCGTGNDAVPREITAISRHVPRVPDVPPT